MFLRKGSLFSSLPEIRNKVSSFVSSGCQDETSKGNDARREGNTWSVLILDIFEWSFKKASTLQSRINVFDHRPRDCMETRTRCSWNQTENFQSIKLLSTVVLNNEYSIMCYRKETDVQINCCSCSLHKSQCKAMLICCNYRYLSSF